MLVSYFRRGGWSIDVWCLETQDYIYVRETACYTEYKT